MTTWTPIACARMDGTEIIYRTGSGAVGRCAWRPADDEGPAEWWDTDADQAAHPVSFINMPA